MASISPTSTPNAGGLRSRNHLLLNVLQEMKTIVAILFILGIGWALLAWMVVLLPIGFFMPEYRYQSHDVAFSVVGSFLALTGYWIWFGWGYRWKTGRYPLVSSRSFWTISLLNHALWAVAIPFGYEETVAEFWAHGDTLPFRSWIVVNITVAIIGLFSEGGNPKFRNNKAEQAHGEQRLPRPEFE